MTNIEAIETLRANYPDACYEQLREVVDMTIEALKAPDAAGDTISRQAAIDVIEAGRLTKLIDAETAINGLRELPPVQSERKSGKWIPRKCGGLCCSECGGYALDISDGNSINIIVPSNYCPHCGASMKNRHSIIVKDLNQKEKNND